MAKESENIQILQLEDTKHLLGQFYTTRFREILQGITIPSSVEKIIEPFAGNGDLITFIRENSTVRVEEYDILPKRTETIQRDTLMNPPSYKQAYVVSNPPYLARNKSTDKTIFDRYKENDLYKCFLRTCMDAIGGILILPLNFFCSIRACTVRGDFLQRYRIIRLNIFETAVFEDTDYTICSFSYIQDSVEEQNIRAYCFGQEEKEIPLCLKKSENWVIGAELHSLVQNPLIRISRLLEGQSPSSNIVLYAIDNPGRPIQTKVEEDENLFYGKDTSRGICSICWNVDLDLDDQIAITILFNAYLAKKRKQYNSLFLSNYREMYRKRISFELAFRILNRIVCIYCHQQKYKLKNLI